ncbi:cob(I)yrinic acid a,c-diamide adenosyltransferase [Fusibacter bizertensis]
MLKIYTRTGDSGETSLYDGARVPKDSVRVESYGTVDELNSMLGLARQYTSDTEITAILLKMQRSLFNVAGELATTVGENFPEKVTAIDVKWLEDTIDHYLDLMDRNEIFQFIIPGSNLLSANLHVARTICRRAERRILSLNEESQVRPELMKYINRLSDTLYAIARYSETELLKVEFKK